MTLPSPWPPPQGQPGKGARIDRGLPVAMPGDGRVNRVPVPGPGARTGSPQSSAAGGVDARSRSRRVLRVANVGRRHKGSRTRRRIRGEVRGSRQRDARGIARQQRRQWRRRHRGSRAVVAEGGHRRCCRVGGSPPPQAGEPTAAGRPPPLKVAVLAEGRPPSMLQGRSLPPQAGEPTVAGRSPRGEATGEAAALGQKEP